MTIHALGNSSRGSWSSLVGIVTAIIGNVVISFALNTQRYAHIRIDREYNHGEERKKTRTHLSEPARGYGTAAVQQEEAAEERARLNAEAPGLGNDDGAATDTLGQPPQQDHQPKRKTSFDSEETARPHEKDDDAGHKRKSYLQSPYWWIGITLMVIGETGNFLAYGFAPASIVSPLGVVALISNCLIAPWMLKERFRQRDFWGVLISIGGAVTVVLSAKTSEQKMGPEDLWNAIKRWEFLTYIGITCALIIVLMYLSPRYGKRTILIDLGLVALSGGYTALSTKGVASMISGSLLRALTFPITYPLIIVLVLSAVFQIRYVNRALSNFNSTQVIPTQFVFFTLSVIIGSAILYRDFEKTNVDHVIKFIVGCALTFTGVWLITSGRKDENENDEEANQDETIQLIDEEAAVEDERTPLKHERPSKLQTRLSYTARRHSVDDVTSDKPSIQTSMPAVQLIPSDENTSSDPWMSSTDHLERMETPQTPGDHREDLYADSTPNLTPISPTSTRRPGAVGRVDSAPADPQTPAQGKRAPSPPKVDTPALPPGEIIETPNSTFFRSARGSISRLLPGPFLGPLSSSSLSTVVAESLLKGEGSPQGPVRSRSYHKRPRPPGTMRSERSRRRSTTAILDIDEPDLESGLTTPTLSRWQTRDTTATASGRERSNTGDLLVETGESSTDPRSSRRSLLPALSPSLSRLVSMVKDRSKDKESSDRDGAGEGSSSQGEHSR